MLWMRTPEKVYFKKGCMPVALMSWELLWAKTCFIVTDSFLYKNGYTKAIEDKLDQMGIVHTCFSDVEPDPSLASAKPEQQQCAPLSRTALSLLAVVLQWMPEKLCGCFMRILTLI